MLTPSPRQVFDDPSSHWTFLTQGSDNDFEGQHFDRKEAGQAGVSVTALKKQLQDVRKEITQTLSAFANKNIEGGLLVLGVASDGTVSGIDLLSEEHKNSLTDFAAFLHHQAAEAKFYQCTDYSGSVKTICLIFVPHTTSGFCETPGRNPKGLSSRCDQGFFRRAFALRGGSRYSAQWGVLVYERRSVVFWIKSTARAPPFLYSTSPLWRFFRPVPGTWAADFRATIHRPTYETDSGGSHFLSRIGLLQKIPKTQVRRRLY